MSKLKEQMKADLQLKGFKPNTQRTYLREVSNFARYFDKSPEELGKEEVKEYLLHLMNDKKLSQGTFKSYVSGIKFLYNTTLNRHEVVEDIKYPKAKIKLDVVLDLSEIEALFSATDNIKHKVILMITYSAGLRISETSRLKITDIDSKRMMVRVEQGKGGKDRYTILAQTALDHLRQYWRQYHPKEWLFEGQKDNAHITTSTIYQIFCEAKKRAGITKPASVHTLRHYAEFRIMPSSDYKHCGCRAINR
jgi:site-specific recombinase XerD